LAAWDSQVPDFDAHVFRTLGKQAALHAATLLRSLTAALLCVLFVAATEARTLRLASAFDPNSLDPHSVALLYQTRVVTQIYESLVNRDRDYRNAPARRVVP
jgi:ABC-type oligopeptide transport system substrate-binding subunit